MIVADDADIVQPKKPRPMQRRGAGRGNKARSDHFVPNARG